MYIIESVQMFYITKREFDEMVDLNVDNSTNDHDSYRNVIISIIEYPEEYLYDLILDQIDEPIYLLIKGVHEYPLEVVNEINESGNLYGLILIDINVDELSDQSLRVRELHWYNSIDILDDRFSILELDPRALKVLGLYGHAIALLKTTNLIDIPFESLIMRHMNVIQNEVDEYTRRYLLNTTILDSDIDWLLDLMTDPSRYDQVKMKYIGNRESFLTGPRRFNTSEIEILSLDNPSTDFFNEESQRDRYLNLRQLELTRICSRYFSVPQSPNLRVLKLIGRAIDTGSRIIRTRTCPLLYNYPTFYREFPDLEIYQAYRMNIKSYENTFDQLENVTEVKIDASSEIPSSIYDMPSLRLLILFRPTLEVLKNIDHDRIGDRFEIGIDEIADTRLYDLDRMIEFIGDHENILADRMIRDLSHMVD